MFRKSSFPDHGLHFLLRLFQWGKDRPPTGQLEQYSPQTSLGSAMNSASTPGGYGTQPSPYFPQYGGPPGPMTPQGNFAVTHSPLRLLTCLQVQVRLAVLPGKLLSNTPLMAVKPCLDKECPA